MLGQFMCVVDEFDEDDEDDEEGEGLDDAAFAMAAPPPTRTPVMVRAARAFRSRDFMFVHLLSKSCRAPVKTGHLRVRWDPPGNGLGISRATGAGEVEPQPRNDRIRLGATPERGR
jgi:hypothetical protein